jgi:geranylgeranyl reductase family protein
MESCDVLIVGGGPAGSSCARRLRRAGLDVAVIDRAAFPRDKVCAGWITPQVVAALDIDVADYANGRTFQPVTTFRTGLIGAAGSVETRYDAAVSFGIRRTEFDHYLLERSGARLKLGKPVSRIQRVGTRWIVNAAVSAPMLVGAGGHFCPVARYLNPDASTGNLVIAQEAEFPIDSGDASWRLAPGIPELYFSHDLNGYGWCFRKGAYLNIGLGRLDRHGVKSAVAEFVDFLRVQRKVPGRATWRWCGHAYLVEGLRPRRATGEGVLLAGDAAGLAVPQSGEGIWPAVRSGLLAASAILEASGVYTRERLAGYDAKLRRRYAVPTAFRASAAITTVLGRRLLERPWFVRHIVLDRWFLHRTGRELSAE